MTIRLTRPAPPLPDHQHPSPDPRPGNGHGGGDRSDGRRTALSAWRRRGPCALRTRRAPAVLAVAACLALAAAGCIARDVQAESTSHAASAGASGTPRTHTTASAAPLARIAGLDGLVLTISSATRTSSGVLTLRGTLKNTGNGTAVVPAALRGNEHAIARNGQSLGGATLADFEGRKRYYVLRDTEGRPLTTTVLSSLRSGESVAVFMQFPAPPARTRQVDFYLPQFDTATLPLS